MDSFESETVSSDSSAYDPIPDSPPKEVRKRKIRTTDEFAPLDASVVQQKINKQDYKRQKVSFLPKIDDLVEDDHCTRPDVSAVKPKQHRPSFATKIASLKKLKIKKKRIKAKAKPSASKRKLQSSESVGVARRLNLEPSNLAQVLSEAVEEFRSDARMSLKLKREKNGWKSVSREESSPRVVFKDLYVNLTPLEKTNLLNEQQLQELQCRKLPNNRSHSIQSHLGKENIKNEVEMPRIMITKSTPEQQSSFSEYYRPCKVLLQRLSPAQMKHHYLLNRSNNDNNTLVIRRISSSLGNSFSSSIKRSSSEKEKSLLMSTAIENVEESFHPGETSSPLVLLSKSEMDESMNTDESKIVARRLTYKIGTASSERSIGMQSFGITGCENLNGTYEVDDLRKSGDDEADGTTGKRRRSTLTLEDSINDIALLKSTCDSNGTPQKLIGKKGRRHSCNSVGVGAKAALFRNVMAVKLKARSFHEATGKKTPGRSFANVTVRKHSISHANSSRPTLQRQEWFDEGSLSPSSDLENTSPPEDLHGTFDVNDAKSSKADDRKLCKSETSRNLTEEFQANNEGSPISISSTSDTPASIRDSTAQKASALQTTTPKSVLKSKNSKSRCTPRRVTFSNVSVIIIDDTSGSQGSIVPTQFHSDDSDEDLSGNLPSAGKTPGRGRKKMASLDLKRNAVFLNNTTLDSSSNRSTLLGSPVPTRTPKRTKMPDFTKIHQKMFDKMLDIKEYSQKKQKRAQLLLSKHKSTNGSSLKGSDHKHAEPKATQIPKMVKSKKRLQYSADSSAAKPILKIKKTQLASSTSKQKKGESGCGQYGFKGSNCVSKTEQKKAVANKTRPLKSHKENTRTEIKGVRCNRRFELLMQMRQKKLDSVEVTC